MKSKVVKYDFTVLESINEELVLDLVKVNGVVFPAMISQHFGVGKFRASKILKDMCVTGLLKDDGVKTIRFNGRTGRNRVYVSGK